MSKTTLQSLFNKAVRGLAKQKFRRAMSNDGTCEYLVSGGKGKGNRCAIGHLLTEKQAREMTNVSYSDLHVWRDIPSHIKQVLPKRTGGDLQYCHDTAINAESMKHKLRDFANRYMLKVPKELL